MSKLRFVLLVAALVVGACAAADDGDDARPATSTPTTPTVVTTTTTASGPTTTVPPTTVAPIPTTAPVIPLTVARPRFQVFGDSTALVVAGALADWAARSGTAEVVQGYTPPGCGFGRGGLRSIDDGKVFLPIAGGCTWTEPWRDQLVRYQPDVAIAIGGTWDVIPRKLPGEDVVRVLGDPVYDAWLSAELRKATELLLAHTEHVVWITQPPPAPPPAGEDDAVIERIERFNELAQASTEGLVSVTHVDLASWVAHWPGGIGDKWLRPDAIHFSNESAPVVADWLGPAIIRAANSPTGTVVGP